MNSIAQFFEGRITYRLEFFNTSPFPDSIFRMMYNDMDTSETLFYSNGNYKTITNKGKSVTLLNSELNGLVYSYVENSDIAICYDYIKKSGFNDSLIQVNETDTILGIPCKKLNYVGNSLARHYSNGIMYYSDKILIDKSRFENYKTGYFELIFREYGTIPLKIILTGEDSIFGISLTAVKIDQLTIEPETFNIPIFREVFNMSLY